MFPPDIVEALETLPGIIHLSSGDTLVVTDRKFVLVGENGVAVVIDGKMHYLAPFHIARVTPGLPAAPSK